MTLVTPAQHDSTHLLDRTGAKITLETLVYEHRAYIFRLCLSILNDENEAEDLTQETFVKAVNALDHHPPERNVSGWILSIAHNTATDYVRVKRLDTVPLDDSPVVTPPSGNIKATAIQVPSPSESTPTSRAEARALRPAIERAIRKLKGNYRRVVMLRFVEGRSYEDVAKTLGLPLGTVKNYLHRARKKLKKMLGPVLDSSPSDSPGTPA